MFDNFLCGLLSFAARRRVITSCPLRMGARVSSDDIRVHGGLLLENRIVSVLTPAIAGLPLGSRHP